MLPTRKPTPSTPSIAALPSLAHSLSSFPTMTFVTRDMVHYGRTKDASEAKLNSALRRTKQRQDTGPDPTPQTRPSSKSKTLYPIYEDDDHLLLMTPKRYKEGGLRPSDYAIYPALL
ncbi:hypothetical protein A0H81_08945 [Grifola frondosa]|uniref:Uncharacterized protein n=1 Tax=Grifola frondosa TaxID=5627 RepID=A0A1C7M3V6_GRIFR|nr:hypothetical protein A0H81_08945 [Grifola frondosa]